MRTAQSLPSTTTSRPVAKRRPLTNRSIGSSGDRSSSTTAPSGRPTTSAVGMLRAAELGPHAHRDARERRAAPRGSPLGGRRGRAGEPELVSARELVERAVHADHERVRDELHEPARLAADREGRADDVRGRRGRRPPPRYSASRTSASRACRSRPRCRAPWWSRRRPWPSSGSWPRRPRRARARSARCAVGGLGLGPPIIAAASRRAPSSVITNTLPPVTPST